MKKLSILILLTLTSFHLHAQINWLSPGAKWYYDYADMGGTGLTVLEVLEEDTIIGSITFKRMLSTTYTVHWSGSDLDTFFERLYAREEDGVVFGYEPEFYPTALYDFTQSAGDTLHGMLNGGLPLSPFIVVSTGDFTINGLTLPFQDIRFTDLFDTGEYDEMRVVQGIGSLNSFFFHSHLILQPFDAPFYTPICYEDPTAGIIHLTDPARDCDFFINPVATTELNVNDVIMHPNPASAKITITHSAAAVTTIAVFDLQGITVAETTPSGNETTTIDLTHCLDGLYIVRGLDERGITRFAKQVLVRR